MNDPTMTDKLIDQTAEKIRESRLDDDTAAAATDRVWTRLQHEFVIDAPLRSCADVQALLPAFVAGELGEAKALLVDDHTRGCVPCRRALLEQRGGGERSSRAAPSVRVPVRIPVWLRAAAAVVLMIGAGFVATTTGRNMMANRSLTAQIVSTDGSLQLVTAEETTQLAAGDTIRARQRVRTTKDSGAFVGLADGSLIEMAPRSEISLSASRQGSTIALGRGNIIVHAAEQGRGRLGVSTNECDVAVKGTIFAVNHGLKGSRVSVIEGEVEVRQGRSQSLLHPGEQLTTDQRLRSVAIEDEISWSANAEEHRRLLAELTQLQIDVAEAVDIAAPRTSTRLLELAPPDTVLYVAMPNITDGLGAARQIFDSRLAESEVLRDWWQREIVAKNIDTQIEESLDQLQFLGEALGDEVVVALGASGLAESGAPLFLAELDDPQVFRALIEEHLANHTDGTPPIQLLDDPADPVAEGAEVLIWLHDDLVVAAHSSDLIQGVANAAAGGSSNPFADTELYQQLDDRYASGVEWLFGLDLRSLFAGAAIGTDPAEAAIMERFGLLDATTMVVERQRTEIGSDINGEVRFSGVRRGVAAWLAEPAPLSTLDFVSPNATLVSSSATKDGVELFDELLALVAESGPEALTELEGLQNEFGFDLRDDLAAAIGGEGTFALDGPILPVPTWKLILEVYDPAMLQHAIEQMVDRANTELESSSEAPITIQYDEAGGLTFTTLSHPRSPLGITYTMTDGFLVAGSNRAAVENAIQVRAGGMGLAGSAVFRELLPDNGFTDCSALVFRNFAPIIGAIPTGAISGDLTGYEELLRETAAPGLFCVYGMEDRILISGSGPSLVGFAPLLGMQSLFALDEVAEGTPDELSSRG